MWFDVLSLNHNDGSKKQNIYKITKKNSKSIYDFHEVPVRFHSQVNRYTSAVFIYPSAVFYDEWEHDVHLLVIILLLLLYIYTSVHKSCRKYYWRTLACKVVVGSVSGSGARATGPSEIITFIDGGKKKSEEKKNTRSLIGGGGLRRVLCSPNIASGSTRLSPFSADTRCIATSSITIIICTLAYYNILCTSVRRGHPSIIIRVRLVQLYKVGIYYTFFLFSSTDDISIACSRSNRILIKATIISILICVETHLLSVILQSSR